MPVGCSKLGAGDTLADLGRVDRVDVDVHGAQQHEIADGERRVDSRGHAARHLPQGVAVVERGAVGRQDDAGKALRVWAHDVRLAADDFALFHQDQELLAQLELPIGVVVDVNLGGIVAGLDRRLAEGVGAEDIDRLLAAADELDRVVPHIGAVGRHLVGGGGHSAAAAARLLLLGCSPGPGAWSSRPARLHQAAAS